MHSCHVQLNYVDGDHDLMTPVCAGCLLTACSTRGVGSWRGWMEAENMPAAELSFSETWVCVITSVHNLYSI